MSKVDQSVVLAGVRMKNPRGCVRFQPWRPVYDLNISTYPAGEVSWKGRIAWASRIPAPLSPEELPAWAAQHFIQMA